MIAILYAILIRKNVVFLLVVGWITHTTIHFITEAKRALLVEQYTSDGEHSATGIHYLQVYTLNSSPVIVSHCYQNALTKPPPRHYHSFAVTRMCPTMPLLMYARTFLPPPPLAIAVAALATLIPLPSLMVNQDL